MESWGFQWYKNKSFSAGVGRAGFGLNAIDVTVKN